MNMRYKLIFDWDDTLMYKCAGPDGQLSALMVLLTAAGVDTFNISSNGGRYMYEQEQGRLGEYTFVAPPEVVDHPWEDGLVEATACMEAAEALGFSDIEAMNCYSHKSPDYYSTDEDFILVDDMADVFSATGSPVERTWTPEQLIKGIHSGRVILHVANGEVSVELTVTPSMINK